MSEITVGFKGTDSHLKCKSVQYEVGKTYFLDDKDKLQELPEGYNIVKNKVKLCSKEAIHFCKKLEDVFSHYPNNGSNRYFKVEALGEIEDDAQGKKSGTRCIRFVEEISAEEIKQIEKNNLEEKLDKRMHLDVVRELQEQNPNLIVGGSISLYLQGVRLKRFETGSVDYDFILPYFQLLKSEKHGIGESDEEDFSGSDFEQKLTVDGVKADVRISPKEKYELLEYKGFAYKIVPLLVTLEAKVRYGLKKSGEKHRNDIKEMILNTQ